MNLVVREFNDRSDYDRLVEVEKAVWPDEYASAEYFLHEDESAEGHFWRRYLAEGDGVPIGDAELIHAFWWKEPQQYYIYLAVKPDCRGQGAGRQLYEQMVAALAGQQPRVLVSTTREDQTDGIAFLQRRGFKMVQRDKRSRLDLADFERERFAEAFQVAEQAGVSFTTAAALKQKDADWRQRLHDLHWPIRQDMPSSEKPIRLPLDEWAKYMLDHPYATLDGYIVAQAPGGELIGYSAVQRDSSGMPRLHTQSTGVLRAWRRKGIATALKVLIADYALANGYQQIVTSNEESNPMYDLNIQLGFRPIPAWLTFKKQLE